MKKLFLASALFVGGLCSTFIPAFAEPIPVTNICKVAGNVTVEVYNEGVPTKKVRMTNGNNFRVDVTWTVVAKNVKTGETEIVGSGRQTLGTKETVNGIALIIDDYRAYTNYRVSSVEVLKCEDK